MIRYGLPSYYKNELIKRINDSIYYSVSFGEAVNSYTKVSILDIGIVLVIC